VLLIAISRTKSAYDTIPRVNPHDVARQDLHIPIVYDLGNGLQLGRGRAEEDELPKLI
jgi:hypothetical protein